MVQKTNNHLKFGNKRFYIVWW